MKLSTTHRRLLVLAAIVLLCGIAAQLFGRREGLENPKFTGIMFFTTDTCGHCQALKPTITRLQSSYSENVTVVDCTKPDDAVRETMKEYNINRFPTILKFDDGQRVGSPIEDRDYANLEKIIKELTQ